LDYAYSTGRVVGDSYVGGLVGYVLNSPAIDDTTCLWDVTTSKQSDSEAGTGCTTAALKAEGVAWASGTPGSDYWAVGSLNNGYPYLKNLDY
jgi:hypothetical protein